MKRAVLVKIEIFDENAIIDSICALSSENKKTFVEAWKNVMGVLGRGAELNADLVMNIGASIHTGCVLHDLSEKLFSESTFFPDTSVMYVAKVDFDEVDENVIYFTGIRNVVSLHHYTTFVKHKVRIPEKFGDLELNEFEMFNFDYVSSIGMGAPKFHIYLEKAKKYKEYKENVRKCVEQHTFNHGERVKFTHSVELYKNVHDDEHDAFASEGDTFTFIDIDEVYQDESDIRMWAITLAACGSTWVYKLIPENVMPNVSLKKV